MTERSRWWAPGDKLAPWILQTAGVAMIFATFAAAVFLALPVEQAGLFAGTGVSLALLGRSLTIGGGG